jgi:hypothetical protein
LRFVKCKTSFRGRQQNFWRNVNFLNFFFGLDIQLGQNFVQDTKLGLTEGEIRAAGSNNLLVGHFPAGHFPGKRGIKAG